MTEEERLGRLERRIEGLEGKFSELATSIGEIKTHGAVADTVAANIVARLENIENSLRWVIRLVIGVLLLAAMSAFVITGTPPSFPPGI